MSFLYDYMTDDELVMACENASFDNAVLKIDNQFKIVAMEHSNRISDIETQVLLENYTDDDLTRMYIKENEIYTEGVKEVWHTFVEWLKGIVNAILGKTKAIEKPEKGHTIKLPTDPTKLGDRLSKMANAVKNWKKYITTDGKLNIAKIASYIGVGAVMTAAAGGLHALFSSHKEEAWSGDAVVAYGAVPEISRGCSELVSVSDQIRPDEFTGDKAGILSDIKNAISSAIKFAQNIINKILSFLKPNKSGNKDQSNPESDNNEHGQSSEGGAQKQLPAGEAQKQLPAGEAQKQLPAPKSGKTDDITAEDDEFYRSNRMNIKNEMVKTGKRLIVPGSKGQHLVGNKIKANHFKINEMKAVLSLAKKEKANGNNTIKANFDNWERLIKYMDAKGITEFVDYTYDELSDVYMESEELTLDTFMESYSTDSLLDLASSVDFI